MADATTEYNLEQAKAQLDRCEQNYAQLQEVARRSLDELATLRQLMQTIAQQMGVEVVSTPAPPVSPVPSGTGEMAPPVRRTEAQVPDMPKSPPDEPPKPPEPLHTSGSGTRSSGSVGRSGRSGDKE